MEEDKKGDFSDFMVRSKESISEMKKGIHVEPMPIKDFYKKENERLSLEEGEPK